MVHDLGVQHHGAVISHEELAGRLEDAVRARDLPGMADIDSSLLWFSEGIKQDFTVALSGECADEIFGGYPWFYQKELLEDDHFPWMKSEDGAARATTTTMAEKIEFERVREQSLSGNAPRGS